jgi:uncharacterized protein YndB with AHSA1/START domain
MTKSIQHKLFYPHSPAIVWEYLTTPELMAQWLMPTDFQPIVGFDFQFRTNPIPKFDFDGIVYCKVLEVVAHKKLSYSWKGGPGDGTITMDSVVIWTLAEKDGGTDLSLEHSGFKVLTNLPIFQSMEDGWLKNMKKIAEQINAAKHGSTHA